MYGAFGIYIYLYGQALFSLIFFLAVRENVKSSSAGKSPKAKKEHFLISYFLISVALNLACYLILMGSSESMRYGIRVLSAPFIIFALTLFVVAGMQMVWSFNQFDFWKMVPGEGASKSTKEIYLAAATLNLFVSLLWAVFYFWI